MLVFSPKAKKRPASPPPDTQVQADTAPMLTAAPEGEAPAGIETTQDKTQPEEFYELSNSLCKVKFTSRGAGVVEFIIERGGGKQMGSVPVIQAKKSAPAFATNLTNHPTPLFEIPYRLTRLDAEKGAIEFEAGTDSKLLLRKRYELFRDKPALLIKLEVENTGDAERQIPLEILNHLYYGKVEGYDSDQLESFIVPKTGKIQVAKEGKLAKKPQIVQGPIDWQALAKKYFASILKPDRDASYAESRALREVGILESTLKFAPTPVPPGGKYELGFLAYVGPEFRSDLKSFGFGFEQTLTQGVWGIFRYYLFVSLQYCRNWTGNYGLAIALLTFVIKLLFSPFTHMSFESMRKMQAVQPKIKSIQDQYKKDPAKLNKEMMELYRRHKVNPMGGCLPMVIQIPIFFGFYQVLAQMVELTGESFWWIKDLTEPDRLAMIWRFDFNLLPLFMVGSMIWQQRLMPQPTSSPEQAMIMKWMPVIFGFFFYTMPSGLVIYWTLSNVLSILHQLFVHRKVAPALD